MDGIPALLPGILVVAAAILGLAVWQFRRRQRSRTTGAPGAPLVLRGVRGTYAGNTIPFDGRPIVMGRDPAVAHLVFPQEERSVSGKHCGLTYDGTRVMIEDYRSTNGTYLDNGSRIEPGRRLVLRPGTRFYVGSRDNTFELLQQGRRS